nr:hypothetical protein [Spirochaetaceae bacterium]
DILRALYYFWDSDHSFNERMDDALESLKSKQRKDDLWPVNAPFAGEVHLTMESPGKASRWNTLRALSVLGEFFIVQNKSSQ